jgi:hypothetical protein
MRNFNKYFLFLYILIIPTVTFASGASGNLDLWKRDPFLYGYCGHCAELLSFTENRDRASFSEYNLQERSGYYTINLRGSKGIAVTLYGQEDFKAENGYLVIIKEDNKDLEITNLEGFPPGVWTTINPQVGGKYSVFYQPHQDFKSLVASIQWGKGPQSGEKNKGNK